MDKNPSTSSDPFDNFILFDDNILEELITAFPPILEHDVNNVEALLGPPTVEDKSREDVKDEERPKPCQHKRKQMAVDVERRRRKDMAALQQSLRSYLPAEYIKGKRSVADHLGEAVRYIKDLQGGIKESSKKRDELLMKISEGCSSSSNSNLEYVQVKPCRGGFIEIIVNVLYDDKQDQQRLPLSKLLHILSREGLNVVHCVSSRVNNNLIHSLQAQVDDGRDIDPFLLERQIRDYL